MKKDTMGCSGWLVLIILIVIFEPILHYFCGWITGIVLQMWIGDTVVNGMNYLFNTNRFTVDMLPTICGTLGVVGSFFKRNYTSSK